MKNKHLFLGAIMAFAACFCMTACKKTVSDESGIPPGKEQLSLYLTDGPGLFDKVLIDTRRHDNDDWDSRGSNDNKKDSSFVWETLNITPGVYDVLTLRNGVDTLLAASNITKGAIRLIKIEFGTNNSVVKDSVTYPLYLPSNAKGYVLIKLKGHECDEFRPGKKRLWLDFDITRSIIQERDNKFYLRPVFHFFTVAATGSISGKIGPADGYPVVTIFNAKDTAYALPNKEGNFKVRGIPNGTYSVYVNASNGYADTTITGVNVTAPKETSIGTIKLHK
jgi:hypothetical protein